MSTTHISEPIEPNAKSKDGPLLETISLRDYFAAKAMQGFCAGNSTNAQEIAQAAYIVADAMLARRGQ